MLNPRFYVFSTKTKKELLLLDIAKYLKKVWNRKINIENMDTVFEVIEYLEKKKLLKY